MLHIEQTGVLNRRTLRTSTHSLSIVGLENRLRAQVNIFFSVKEPVTFSIKRKMESVMVYDIALNSDI